MEIQKQMSEWARNKFLRNENIYQICLEELKDENKIYPQHFTYDESLEFSNDFRVLRLTNINRLRVVLSSIRKKLKDYTRGITKEEKKEMEKRRKRNYEKLNNHLNKLKILRKDSQSNENKNKEVEK